MSGTSTISTRAADGARPRAALGYYRYWRFI